MEKIKRVLKVLGYVIGGLICSALIVGIATLIILGITLLIGWLMSFQSIALITQWIMNIIVGLLLFITGVAMFVEIVEWTKSKINK